ncbi:hypothetical protein KXX16_008935 [Aspergillus fumigatus]|nr:hypothetical protein KXX16_008935 [Aspergillus fumigatus]KAH2811957.1 hypothetical protein KXV23_005461 [Aspergillus fumigatus]KAH3192300.1 hypothetical protein KXX02_007409 [Aspergillus fumigatus]KAH3249223.1 hypothetical protein KXW31_009655 [Aspergillus fumigatus]
MNRVVLITGVNRGIGRGLAAHYLAQPGTTVIGTVRDNSSEKAKDLSKLPKGRGCDLIIVPLSVDNPSRVAEAASEIQTRHHIEHIDVVIANAGICNHWGPIQEMTDLDVLSHFAVNTLGPLRLFTAMAPLLQRASTPKFVYISTLLASIHAIEQMPSLTAAYGMSKVAGNYLVKKIDAENKHSITLSIDPGLVQTDMGSRAAQLNGLEKAPVTVEDTVPGITRQSKYFKQHNPRNHPSLNDSCVRKVPLSQIPPELVNDALNGVRSSLRGSARVYGVVMVSALERYAIQRNILAQLGRNDSNKDSIMWDRKQLLNSTYEEGANVTNHFVVVGKTPRSVVLWGAHSPSENPGVPRDMENLAEITTDIDIDEGMAEFRLKNIFYNGKERTSKDLFPPPIVWLHFQYCKLLVEAGVSHCKA